MQLTTRREINLYCMRCSIFSHLAGFFDLTRVATGACSALWLVGVQSHNLVGAVLRLGYSWLFCKDYSLIAY